MEKVLVFHHSDLDGIGVKLVGMMFASVHNLGCETFKCNYGDVDQIITDRFQEGLEDVQMIVIGDISVQSKEMAETLDNLKGNIKICLRDHHATATWLNKYDWAEVKEKDEDGVYRCGTWWTAKTLLPMMFRYPSHSITKFINLVDMYDTWKWMDDPENPYTDADDLNSVFKMLGEHKFTDWMFNKLEENTPIFDELATTLVDVRKGQLKAKANRLMGNMKEYNLKYEITNSHQLSELLNYYEENAMEGKEKFNVGYEEIFRVGIVFEGADISDLGNLILEENPQLDFLIFVSLPGLMSYRTRKTLSIPLGLMSKYITGHGGGHAQAAGGSLHPRLYDKVLRNIVPYLEDEIKEVQND